MEKTAKAAIYKLAKSIHARCDDTVHSVTMKQGYAFVRCTTEKGTPFTLRATFTDNAVTYCGKSAPYGKGTN